MYGRRLAGARSAGQDDQSILCRPFDRLTLARRVGQLTALLQRVQQGGYIKIIRKLRAGQLAEIRGDKSLRIVHHIEIDRIVSADLFPAQTATADHLVEFPLQTVGIQLNTVLIRQQFPRRRQQFFARDKGVSVVQIELKDIGEASIHAFGRLERHAHTERQIIRQYKIHTEFLAAQQIRILQDHIDRAILVLAVQTGGQLERQVVFQQKFHQPAHCGLLTELLADVIRFFLRDAADDGQAVGIVGQDIKRLLPELLRDAPRELRTDALDHAGGQIFRDALRRRREPPLKVFGFELFAVGGMGRPRSRQVQLLAQTDLRQCADDRHLVAALGHNTQHRVAVVLILIDHGLYGSAYGIQFHFVHGFAFCPRKVIIIVIIAKKWGEH